MRRVNKMFEGIPNRPDGFISPEQIPDTKLTPEEALIASETPDAVDQEIDLSGPDGGPELPPPDYDVEIYDRLHESNFLPVEDAARERMYERFGVSPRQALIDAVEKLNEKMREREVQRAGANAWADPGFRSNKKRTPKPPGKSHKGEETIRKLGIISSEKRDHLSEFPLGSE